jgi:15-cis-phytoene synthase / lycopene beta-cyclase
MHYQQIHNYLTLPVLSALLVFVYPAMMISPFETMMPLAILCFLSFSYTTPWDNYLVAKGGWSYPDNSVMAIIGYIPVEEYAFFIIQTLITGLLWTAYRWFTIKVPLFGMLRSTSTFKYFVLSCLGLITAISYHYAIPDTPTFYLGMILSWSLPVLILQLFVAFDYIISSASSISLIVTISTVYLWLVDTIAISQGAWEITSNSILGIYLNPHLPIEEAIFFLVTNLMIIFGLVAIERTLSILLFDPILKDLPLSFWILLKATCQDEHDIPQRVLEDLDICRKVTIKASTSFYISTLLLPLKSRYDFWKLYAFARVCDDYIDDAVDKPHQQEKLKVIRDFVTNCIIPDNEPTFRAVKELNLPQKPLLDLVDGFAMDTEHEFFTSTRQLLKYCFDVAATVGNMSTCMLGRPELSKGAESLGISLQLINIARDVVEDYRKHKRIYVVSVTGESIEKLDKSVYDAITWCLDTSDDIMAEGKVQEAISKLPAYSTRAILSAYVMYKQIGIEIRKKLKKRDGSIAERTRYFSLFKDQGS